MTNARKCITMIAAMLVMTAAIPAAAQETYVDPLGRFEVPIPAGWTDASPREHATFTLADPPARMHVVAAPGEELAVVTGALGILVDPSIDEAFVTSPLQASPVPLPSGTWTQRIYQFGDELIAAISHHRDGVTYVVLARGTQAAFMTAVNHAANTVLLGLRFVDTEPIADGDLPYATEEVVVAAGQHELAGSLALPEGEGPHPAVVLVSGSGAQDRHGANPSLPAYQPQRWLADHLVRSGFAVLRYDERGVAASGGDHATATTYDLADDAEAAIGFLLERPEVDAARVGILGHSEGGVIAAIVAARSPETAFVVSLAGSAVPYSELVVSQVERIALAGGATPEEADAAIALQREAVDLAVRERWEELESLLVGIVAEQLEWLSEAQRAAIPDPEAFARAQAAAQVAAFRSPWMSTFLTLDPAAYWREVDVAVLAVFADLDVQVDAGLNRAALETAVAEGGAELTIVELEGVNHLFQAADRGGPDEYLELEMAFHPELLEVVRDWLVERFVRDAHLP